MSTMVEVKTLNDNGAYIWVNIDNIVGIYKGKADWRYDEPYYVVSLNGKIDDLHLVREETKRLIESGFNVLKCHPGSKDDILELKE